MKLRKSVAAVVLAGAAVFTTAGCSSDNATVNEATSKASEAVAGAASDASEAVAGAASNAKNAIAGLSNDDAQEILRSAVDPATPSADVNKYVDTSNPVTEAAIVAYAKGSNAAGYTPDAYTVKTVEKTADDAATVTVAVKSPHAPEPIDIQLSYVKVDGTWKLSGDAVTQLSSMGSSHGG